MSAATVVDVKSSGTTSSPPDGRPNPAAGIQAGPKVIRRGDAFGQPQKRIFLGPMPERTVPGPLPAPERNKFRKWSLSPTTVHREETELDYNLADIDDEHAFRFFISRGGKEEDWTREADIGARKEILKKWRQSGWASLRARRKNKQKGGVFQTSSRWVGSSFEIGESLGLLNLTQHLDEEDTPRSANTSTILPPTPTPPAEATSSMKPSTSYVTAKEFQSGTGEESIQMETPTSSRVQLNESSSSKQALLEPPEGPQRIHSSPDPPVIHLDADSRPPLNSKARSDSVVAKKHPRTSGTDLRSALKSRLSSFQNSTSSNKGKAKDFGKTVKFPNNVSTGPSRSEERPVDVVDVLVRSGSELGYTSAGASSKSSSGIGQVITLRDRMLVRVAHSRQDVKGYDETHSRVVTDLKEDRWQEFLVVWRHSRLELYEDYTLPCKEMITGHKYLAFVVPLHAPKTKLSLYSFTDMSFSLTCPSIHFTHSKALLKFFHADVGTDIFVFKHKSRSRAIDWTWKLWCQLGGDIPQSIEVHCPVLHTKVHIDIPRVDLNGDDGWRSLQRDRVLQLCENSLSKVQDYQFLIGQAVKAGGRIELAWRREANLDWIWLNDDIDGMARDWAVMYGLALKSPDVMTQLEIRLMEYRSTRLVLQGGEKLMEPPSIEGFLWRIKSNSQRRTLVYMTTHEGYIFICPNSNPHLPQPPLAPGEDLSTAAKRSSPSEEVRRGTAQILEANTVIDIRNIMAIRRAVGASTVSPDIEALNIAKLRDTVSGASDTLRDQATPSDDEDEGGDEGMLKAADKTHLKVKRCLELLMRTGHIIRLEVHSRRLAHQWARHLQDLVMYWTRRHRVNARLEMELRHAIFGTPRFNGFRPCESSEHAPELPPHPDDAAQLLSPFWNWTVLSGSRPVLHCDRVFFRMGIRGQYKLMQMVLVSSHVILFHIRADSNTTAYHRSKTVNLLDAYVCSGLFAMKALSLAVADESQIPRRYQDGLECDDREEDLVFILWHLPHPVDVRIRQPQGTATTSYARPKLNSKRKLLVFKARSRLERDAWCWALNCEIERVVRQHRSREVEIRDTGALTKLKG